MHVRPTVVTALAAALLAAAGCGGSSDGAEEAQSSAPPSASAPTSGTDGTSSSSTPTPKRTYPEDKPATKISAEDVARIWVNAYNDALATGDTVRLRHLALPSCEQCDEFADQIDEVYNAGGRMMSEGKAHVVTSTRPRGTPSRSRTLWQVGVDAAPGTTRSSADAEPVSFPADHYEWLFVLAVHDSRWRVKSLGYVQ